MTYISIISCQSFEIWPDVRQRMAREARSGERRGGSGSPGISPRLRGQPWRLRELLTRPWRRMRPAAPRPRNVNCLGCSIFMA